MIQFSRFTAFMDIRLLRTFVAVAEQRHFGRAAGLCNLSQPAVSHQIGVLEAQVGSRLLNRAARRVSLTVAGEILLEEARRILATVDRAHERMREVAQGAIGRIRLGATSTPGLYLLPPLLAGYHDAHPQYELTLHISPLHELVAQVVDNRLDMAVLGDRPATPELRCRVLCHDDLVVVTHPDHVTARRAAKPSQLAAQRWIVREEGSDTRRRVALWWQRHRVSPAQTMTFAGPDAVKRAVMARLGIAMVSRLTVEEELASGRLREIPLALQPDREIVLVDHPHKHHGAACRAMLARLAQHFNTATLLGS